jgi:hypothetical protein
MANITSQAFLSAMSNFTLNTKGASAFKSTNNPILDLFTETRKKVPDNIDDFTILVRKIETAKNYDSNMFIQLLKFHRLIEKGNGLKGVFYICMMVLKQEDPEMYEEVLKWSHQYPKDILRLARLSSMMGFNSPKTKTSVKIPMNIKYTVYGADKGVLGTKMTKMARTEKKSGNLVTSQNKFMQKLLISSEIELYSSLLAETIKKIILGKLFDTDINLMLFKYLSYQTNHFAVESKIIWSRVDEILSDDVVVKLAFDTFLSK